MWIFVPGEWEGKNIFVRFSRATHRARVFVNGVMITEHEGGFLPFCANVTDVVRYNAVNKVVVKVNNELKETNIPCGTTVTLSNGKKMAKPYFDFFNYSGIQRSVNLVALPKEAVFDITTDYELDGEDAKVSYSIVTTGDHEVKVELLDKEGNQVACSVGKEGILEVKNAHLWQVRNAYLYKMVVRIVDAEEILDEYQEEYLAENHAIMDSYDFVKGEQIWNFANFQTTEGIMRVNGNKKGVFTRQRQPKEVAYILKKRWESLPLDYKG